MTLQKKHVQVDACMQPHPHLQSYPFACAEVYQLFPLEERRQLDLIHCWDNSCVLEKLLQMPNSKVTDSDASAKALHLHGVSRKKGRPLVLEQCTSS